MYKKILVAVDGSENSQRAAEQAAKIASQCNAAKVDVLYILDYDRTRTEYIHNMGRDDLHIDRRNRLAPIESKFGLYNVKHELIIKHGDPGPTIIIFANEGDYDLVVVGSRGLNAFQEMVLGSVSHKVAKRVNAPVMIVK